MIGFLMFFEVSQKDDVCQRILGFKLYIPLLIFTFHCGMGENMVKEWGFKSSSL